LWALNLLFKTDKIKFIYFQLNEAKLTNFGLEVDVFVMLSCPYGILLDDKKFYKPVVSMSEAEMALNPQKAAADSCDFGWTAEFQSLLKGTEFLNRNKTLIVLFTIFHQSKSARQWRMRWRI
jgi:hypothetical protein